MKLTEHGMMTGIQNVGPGWHPLVKQLEADLDALSVDWELLQIKEKFGGLRFYIAIGHRVHDDVQHEMQELVSEAEARSFDHCEACGEPPVEQEGGGWLKTLCAEHRADREEWMRERREARG